MSLAETQSVRIRLFGAFRKFGNGQELEIRVRSGATIAELREALADTIAALPGGQSARALVFESALADETRILAEDSPVPSGQVLAVLPPVCGG